MSEINEHIFEIRYKANPKVLDYRGAWAEAISEHMELPHWKIGQNRIEIHDDNLDEVAFVALKNTGFQIHNTETRNKFPERAAKFYKFASSLAGFEKDPFLLRIGVRSKFCRRFDGKFDDLLKLYLANYSSPREAALKVIDATLLDVGAPLNFKDNIGNFNTLCGAMRDEEMPKWFREEEDFPEVGLYYDIDYWVLPNKEISTEYILDKIKQFAARSWDKFESIYNLIIGRGNE